MTWDQLLQTIASNQQFRMELLMNPKKALKSQGVHPTQEMLDALNNLDRDSLEAVAQAFMTEAHADTALT